MKKILAMTLAAMMCLCTVSFAESATKAPATEAPAATEAAEASATETAEASATEAVIPTTDLGEIEITYEQNQVTMENGVAIALPATWTEAELTDDMTTAGVFYSANDADDSTVMGLAYTTTEAIDVEDLAAQLAETFTNVSVISINGIEMVSYEAADGSYVAYAIMDEQGGLYTMTYTPIPTTEGFSETAAMVLTTLTFPTTAATATAEATTEETAEATTEPSATPADTTED